MSDYLPFEVQAEIIKKLPVKPLLQFRSVSKRWKTLIDSSEFIASYSVGQTQLQRLLVWYEEWHSIKRGNGKKIVSFVDDESTLKSVFAKQEIDPTVLGLPKLYTDSGLSKPYKDLRVVGSSQGLLCLYDSYRDSSLNKSGTTMAVLWNPSIRKSVRIVVPGVLPWAFLHTVLGFGVCPITSDPTIVKITNLGVDMKSKASVEVEVFTLSTGIWRFPSCKLPDKPVSVTWRRVAIDKFIYWFAFYPLDDYSDGLGENKLIMSFDMITQEISLIDLPNSFAHQSSSNFSISKVRGSLALAEYSTTNNEKQDCVVWMMNHGVPNFFTKLFTINTPYGLINILGFMKSGGPMMETNDEFEEPTAFVLYEPCSKDFKYTSFYSEYGSFFVDSYMETLLLLDQQDSSVYPIIN